VKIRHHSSYRALTNTNQIGQVSDEEAPGYVITSFAEIPSVQTYLLAFIVSDFNFVENATVVPPQRVYAKPSSIANGDANYALQVSPGLMKALEDYTGINYTLPKMDQIALPNFAAGAVS
jgi:aminopeptidase N